MKVFYRVEQVAPHVESFSPSAGKPALVVASWQRLGLALDFLPFQPVTRDDLTLAHDRGYVDAVLDLQVKNGFGELSAEVASSLMFTTGSMVAAARHAVLTRENSVSPTSGFHHAGYDHGGGFCTFNGLVVAARVMERDGLVRRIGILDLDVHYGNGTEDIIQRLGLDFIEHYTFGGDSVASNEPDRWLIELPRLLQRFSTCDLVLYQAGADPHEDDDLLSGVFTTSQLRVRDRHVFQTLRGLGVPVAWNLAGGYQTPIEKVLAIHDGTAIEHVASAVTPGAQARIWRSENA